MCVTEIYEFETLTQFGPQLHLVDAVMRASLVLIDLSM